MELSSVLAVLRRWSVTLIASAIVAAAVAYFIANRVPATYASEAQVLVGPINTDENTLGAAQELVQTYGQLVTTDRILDAVIESLGLEIDPIVLRQTITARPESVTRILTIEALAGNPDTAAAIANELVAALDEVASEGQVRPEGEVTVVTAGRPNPDPVQPQVSIIVVLAAAAGLIASLGVALLIDYFSNAVSGRQDLEQLTKAPYLGTISPPRRFRPRPTRPLIVDVEPDSRAALAYRLIASRISAGDPADGKSRILVVLSAEGHEGSGEVAANLAAVLSQIGRRVRLVDANDEDREITHLFGLEATYGLGELAHGDEDLLDRMVHRLPSGLSVIARPPGRDPRLREADRAHVVLERLSKDADVVILNVAPIHRSASALLWARDADGAIVVARRDKTKRDQVSFTADTLRTIGTPLVGAVLHGRHRRPTARSEDRRANAASAQTIAPDTTVATGADRPDTP